jgi:tripartite-type tricarboxylate transporter receptor subunit TctC
MSRIQNLLMIAATAFGLSALAATAVAAADFPTRPVKVIVQTGPGSSIDVSARLLAEGLSKRWGEQVLVINQPGSGGFVAARALASAPADGYTLFFAASSVFVALPEIRKDIASSVASFIPISFIGEQPMAVAVPAGSNIKSMADLAEAAKKASQGLSCAVSTRGGLSHLSGESLRAASGMNLVFINYPGTAQALNDVLGGRVPVLVDSLSALIGPAAGGQIRIIGVGSSDRLSIMKNVPTVGETVKGFEATAWFALVAPEGTQKAVVDKIATDVKMVLADQTIADKMRKTSTFIKDVPADNLPGFIAAQRAKWSLIVQKFAVSK